MVHLREEKPPPIPAPNSAGSTVPAPLAPLAAVDVAQQLRDLRAQYLSFTPWLRSAAGTPLGLPRRRPFRAAQTLHIDDGCRFAQLMVAAAAMPKRGVTGSVLVVGPLVEFARGFLRVWRAWLDDACSARGEGPESLLWFDEARRHVGMRVSLSQEDIVEGSEEVGYRLEVEGW
jgi:hypothetical protein